MTDNLDDRDRELGARLLELLDEPARGETTLPRDGEPGTPEGEREARELLEVLGLLGSEPEPVPPPPSLKGKVLAAVDAGVEGAGDPGAGEDPRLAPVANHPAFGQDRGGESREDREAPRGMIGAAGADATAAARSPGGRFRSFLAAAVVAFMMLGVSGWFYLQLRQQENVVSQLQEQLRTTNLRLEEVSEGRRDVLAALRSMSLLEPGPVEVCPLRPSGEQPVQPQAHGSLVLARENGRWYIRVRNLEPASGNEIYTLWFLDEDQALKKVNLGRGERALEVNASGVPKNMTAAAVTLEPSPETREPTGPRILYGHSREMDRL